MKRHLSLIAASLMLAALAPLPTRAADNTWNNGSTDFLWNGTSLNWSAPTTWVDGDNAIFGATGVGAVTLGVAITVQNQTFNAAGYTIAGGGNTLTLAGTTPTITVNADSTISASLQGTNGLTVQGTGVLTLSGMEGNQYTGGTFIKSGTLILANQGASSSGTTYAVDSIEALDAGARLVIPASFDGTTWTSVRDQIGTMAPNSRLNMTGGTLDLFDEPKNQRIPVPDGNGLITNTGTNVQAGLILVADGLNHSFSGVIADGGPLVGDNVAGGPTPQGPGRQIGIVSFAGQKNGGGGLWTLSGSNTYSGSTRIDQGASIKLVGNGTIGFPTATGSLTGPMRMYGSASDPTRGYLDLNGHNQTIALMQNGNADAKIFNSAVGTVSTLTIGYGNEQVVRNCPYQLMDNQGTGGILALKKVATGPAYIIPGTSTPATNCTQTLGGVNTYSGDTTVEGGHLIMTAASAVSSNSAFRLSTVASQPSPDSSVSLALNYEGTANVRQLWIDGVQQPNGVYGAGTPGINPNSIGAIAVTGATLPNIWNNGSANFTWDTTSANWTSPTAWVQGGKALFGVTGAGAITLGVDIDATELTFNVPGYSITGAGKYLTNSVITANAGTSNVLAVSIEGSSGLEFKGTGTTVLAGDASVPDANHFTGASYFRSGTVVLAAAGAGTGTTAGDSHAVESIEALDTGATVKFGTTFDGTLWVNAPGDQIGAKIPGTKMIMTGGTLDLNNDSRTGGEFIRIPDGFGLIINNGSAVQSALNVVTDGGNHTFSGVIADGNNGVLTGDNYSAGATPQGPGYQIGVVNIGSGGASGSTWTLAGDNTYSGSTRIENNTTVVLAGNHSLGIPTLTNSLTGPMRHTVGSAIDFNGRNQTIALMTDSGSASGKMYNRKTGTVSTLTVGYGNENVQTRAAAPELMDNLGVGGKFAFRKIITQAYTYYNTNITSGDVITNVVTNCIQTLKANCVATYSGDTSVDGGTLKVLGPSAISPNSAYRLSTANYANLWLDYVGDAPVRQLWINGVQQPNGTYGAGTPGIDPTSTGTITVTGFAPAALGVTKSGSNLNFSWAGVYQLQSSTNNVLGPYSAYAGAGLNAATVPINPNVGAVYFRLATY